MYVYCMTCVKTTQRTCTRTRALVGHVHVCVPHDVVCVRTGERGSGDLALSASDDGSLNRVSSSEELEAPRPAHLLRRQRLDE